MRDVLMTLDRTIHRCKQCGRVGRWTKGDDVWWCKDHAPYSAKWEPAEIPPPPPELEGTLIGSASLRMRVKR